MPASGIVILGSVNTDLVIKSARLPHPGETILGGNFYQAAGGKGANQAVAAARTSATPVVFIAAVGDDAFGAQSIKSLQQENLDLRYLKTVSNTASGVALILVDEHGENLISVASGANLQLTPADVDAVDQAVFAKGGVFVSCFESPLPTIRQGLQRAREAGMLTIFNPAPVSADLSAAEIFPLVDVLTPNENEARMLSGIDCATDVGVMQAAEKLQAAGCTNVIITLGSRGCFVREGQASIFVAGRQVSAIDATAAGDTFNGALATALAEGQSLADAANWANGAAAISVTRLGAQPSIPQRAEIAVSSVENQS